MEWYTSATSYATQCLIFGATLGVHTAEAMFVKHMGLMKVFYTTHLIHIKKRLFSVGFVFGKSAMALVVSNSMVWCSFYDAYVELSTKGEAKLK